MFEISTAVGIIAAVFAFFWLLTQWALSTDRSVPTAAASDRWEYDVAAAKTIYQGALVGLHYVTRLAKPYELGDVFVGVALAKADNATGAAAAIRVTVKSLGRFVHTVYNAAGSAISLDRTYIGRCVYATADDTVKLQGNALGYIGRIVAIEGTQAVIELKQFPDELPIDSATTVYAIGGTPWQTTTGDNGGGTVYNDAPGVQVSSTLGLGTIPNAAGYMVLQMDATSEAAHASIFTPFCLQVAKGIVFDVELCGYATSTNVLASAAVDLDIGLADGLTKTDIDPTNHVRLHVDGNDTNDYKLGADDNTTDVAEADLGTGTVVLSKTTQTFDRCVFIVRGTSAGQTEVWINGVQYGATSLASIAFASGNMAAFVNVEKTTDTGVAVIEVKSFKAFGGR